MKRKILSILLSICVLIPCISVSGSQSAFADEIQTIGLDIKVSQNIENSEDVIWYQYTPDFSGTYSFLAYSLYATKAYLYVKETDSQTGEEVYTELTHQMGNDPDYVENGHNFRQFCLTYDLEKGVTYYFTAGWEIPSKTPDNKKMTVMLRRDGYAEKLVDKLDVVCAVTLNAFKDGFWQKDINNEYFYYYNLGKIVSNTIITVHYADGRVVTSIGKDEIDGLPVKFLHEQYYKHWHPQSTSDYSNNALTVEFLDASAQVDIKINQSSYYAVKGKVLDYAGNPVKNASINYGKITFAKTDKDGDFAFGISPGTYEMNVSADYTIERMFNVNVASEYSANNFTSAPIKIVTCDYVNDGTINAKDYSYIIKNLTDSELNKQKLQFENVINFSKDNYEPLNLIE